MPVRGANVRQAGRGGCVGRWWGGQGYPKRGAILAVREAEGGDPRGEHRNADMKSVTFSDALQRSKTAAERMANRERQRRWRARQKAKKFARQWQSVPAPVIRPIRSGSWLAMEPRRRSSGSASGIPLAGRPMEPCLDYRESTSLRDAG